MKLFCGDAICKKPVVIDLDPAGSGEAKPWPVRCDACGASLYPGDVLKSSLPADLEPKRGELMTEVDGRRVSVSSKDFASSASAASSPSASESDDVDRLMGMVEHEHVGQNIDSAAEKKSARAWIVLAVAVMLLGTLAWALGWVGR